LLFDVGLCWAYSRGSVWSVFFAWDHVIVGKKRMKKTKTTSVIWGNALLRFTRKGFRLAPWASRRRRDLLELLDRLNPTIAELSQAIEQEAEKHPEARRLMTHPGVGPLTALAFMLTIGKAERFQCGKQIASYLGLVPLEKSSGNRRRLGHITKQGNSMVRFLLVEPAQVTVRSLPEWRRKYVHLMMRRGRKIAKVAMARRLAVALYWMWRKGWNYDQSKSSVRTRASSEQAMVCSRTPSN
jgi:transposase